MVENMTVLNGIHTTMSQNVTIYMDELEIYRGAPVFTSVIGGSIVANPYH